MKLRFRISLGIVLLAVMFSFALALQTRPAEAKSLQPAVTCYGQAFQIGFHATAGTLYEFPSRSTPYVTSKYCNDINMKLTTMPGPVYVQICFVHANYCNSWKYYTTRNQWYTPATNVLNNTTYVVRFETYSSGNVFGSIAD
jgi:hypothetical protein